MVEHFEVVKLHKFAFYVLWGTQSLINNVKVLLSRNISSQRTPNIGIFASIPLYTYARASSAFSWPSHRANITPHISFSVKGFSSSVFFGLRKPAMAVA